MKKTVAMVLATLVAFADARGGMQVPVRDPLYFDRTHEVIFPWADAKIVVFEFVSASDDPEGPERSREFHDRYLRKIQGVPGAAIITYTFPEGYSGSYRYEATKVGREQNAQMVLWGRTLLGKDGVPLINARLALLEPPVGIGREFHGEAYGRGDSELEVIGELRDVVTADRIDFGTVRGEVDALVSFVSGLAMYYKGAKDGDARLLGRAVAGFREYLDRTEPGAAATARALAHLFVARASFLRARASASEREPLLDEAERRAAEAERINPFDADVFTVQAVVAAERRADTDTIRGLLRRAALLAPDDANVKFNLALLESGDGRFPEAIQQLKNVEFVGSSYGLPEKEAALARDLQARIQESMAADE